jgi:hypothetical protein
MFVITPKITRCNQSSFRNIKRPLTYCLKRSVKALNACFRRPNYLQYNVVEDVKSRFMEIFVRLKRVKDNINSVTTAGVLQNCFFVVGQDWRISSPNPCDYFLCSLRAAYSAFTLIHANNGQKWDEDSSLFCHARAASYASEGPQIETFLPSKIPLNLCFRRLLQFYNVCIKIQDLKNGIIFWRPG